MLLAACSRWISSQGAETVPAVLSRHPRDGVVLLKLSKSRWPQARIRVQVSHRLGAGTAVFDDDNVGLGGPSARPAVTDDETSVTTIKVAPTHPALCRSSQ